MIKNKMDEMLTNGTKEKKVYKYKGLHTEYIFLVPVMWAVAPFTNREKKVSEYSDERTEKIIRKAISGKKSFFTVNQEKETLSKWVRDWGFYWRDYVWMPWDKKYCHFYNRTITEYFFNKFEVEGYRKEVVKDYDWTEIIFTKIK